MLFVSTYPGVLLQKGSKGELVKKIQNALDSQGFPCAVDGDFGSNTETAVKNFQQQKGVTADGKIGPITWEKLFGELPDNEPSAATIAVLNAMRANADIYNKPTSQDLAGEGIFPKNNPNQDGRSERIYPAFVLGPRRQTDSLPRQLYSLLPEQKTAFILTRKLAQTPEEYLPYIAGAETVFLFGSFMGVGAGPGIPPFATKAHNEEFFSLERSIELVQAMNRSIIGVMYAMGDSTNTGAKAVKNQLQQKLDSILTSRGLSSLKQPITWGADEVVLMAFAQTLPPLKVLVRISNPDCQHRFDGLQKSSEIMIPKLDALGLTKVNADWEFSPDVPATDWDFEIAMLSRRPGATTERFQPGDQKQAEFDRTFLDRYRDYTSEQRSKLVIVDSRLHNGAWDSLSALPHCDLLAFGSWGTGGNALGATLAIAKILFHAGNSLANKQLYLEAIAHDVFANGYTEAQQGELKKRVDQLGFPFRLSTPPYTQEQVIKVFNILNPLVNQRMKEHFAGTDCLEGVSFHFNPQLWRTFESEVHLIPPLAPEIAKVGVFRKDIASIQPISTVVTA
jgi:hypothetical protein